MDRGVIRSLKDHYHQKIVLLSIKAFDKNKPLPKISILQEIKDILSSWTAVSNKIVVNCFKKSVISESNQQMAEVDNYDSFKSLIEELDRLREFTKDPSAVQEELSAESFIGLG